MGYDPQPWALVRVDSARGMVLDLKSNKKAVGYEVTTTLVGTSCLAGWHYITHGVHSWVTILLTLLPKQPA